MLRNTRSPHVGLQQSQPQRRRGERRKPKQLLRRNTTKKRKKKSNKLVRRSSLKKRLERFAELAKLLISRERERERRGLLLVDGTKRLTTSKVGPTFSLTTTK